MKCTLGVVAPRKSRTAAAVAGELGEIYAEIKFGLWRHGTHHPASDGIVTGKRVDHSKLLVAAEGFSEYGCKKSDLSR